MTPNPTIDFLRRARNLREFSSTPISDDVLNDILDVARWTGSAMNQQPWTFVVVRDRAKLDQMASAGGYVKHLGSTTVAIVLAMDGAGHEFDEGRLSERILLAAAAHGLGAGVAWFNDAGARAVKQLLGIAPERTARTVIALGYPTPAAQKPRTKPGEARKRLGDIVTWA
jgi:nitroreductase